MGEAIGEMLPGAVAVAISPLPIIGVVLALVSPGGRINGVAYVVGHAVGVAVPAVLLLVAAGALDATERGEPAAWVAWVRLLIGIALVTLAVRQWRARPARGEVPDLPGWMSALDGFGPARMAGAGVMLSAANPKNLIVIAAATAGIVQAEASTAEQRVALILLTVIGSAGVLVPLIVSLVLGERSTPVLGRVKTALGANAGVIMAVILILIGAKLIGDAIEGFTL